MAEAPDHKQGFIEQHRIDIYDYEWVTKLREAKGNTIPFPADMPASFRVNDPLVINGDTLARIRKDGISLVHTKGISVCGIDPSFEQCFAHDLMSDPKVQMVSLWGLAGSGKTTFALAEAIELIKKGGYHNGIHLLKPISYVGRSVGLLPGEMDQKLAPFLASMTQHLEGLMGQRLNLDGMIHFQAVEFQRGMNYENSIMIIDEAQNLSRHEMFTLLTRACETTKIFICGDLTQVDDNAIKRNNNSGLAMVLNNLRHPDDEIVADVQFHKSHRKGISLLCINRLSDII